MIDIISRKLATLASSNAASALLAMQSQAPNLAQLGAVGDGNHATSDQTAFQSAIAAIIGSLSPAPTGTNDLTMFQSGAVLEPGIYDAGGMTMDTGSLRLIARIPGTVVIRIPAGQYFMTVTGRMNGIHIEGITFIGGKGAFKSTYAGNNVNLMQSFQRCFFYNYTECAISNNANDHPYLRVRDCVFYGAGGSATVGVAWGGYADQGLIEHNAFLQNAYHLKLGPRLSSSFTIRHNDFISYGGTQTQADIWLVPNSDTGSYGVNSGHGLLITQNKFGNENQNTAAPRILIAAENTSSGSDRATCGPATTDSGYLSQAQIFSNVFAGLSGITAPVIESRISEARNLEWRGNKFTGAPYAAIVTWTNRATGYYANTNSLFEFTPADVVAGGQAALRFSNAGFAQLRDYGGFFPGDPNAVQVWPASDDPALALLAAGIAPTPRAAFGTASKTKTADPYGGTDFDLVTCTQAGTNNGLAMALGSGVSAAGGPVFVDIALQQAPTRGVAQVTVDLYNYTTGTLAMQRTVTLPATLGRLRMPVQMPANASPASWQLRIYPASTVTVGTTDRFITGDWIVNTGDARIGRGRALAAYPLIPRNQAMIATAAATLPLGWSIANGVGGLTAAIARVGSDANGAFFDLTLSGTTTSGGTFYLYPDSSQTIEAVAGQCWQFYMPLRLTAGSLGNFNTLAVGDGSSGPLALSISSYSAGGGYLAQIDTAFAPVAALALYGRGDWGSSGFAFHASVAEIRPYLRFALNSGVSVSATLRVYVPVIRRMA